MIRSCLQCAYIHMKGIITIPITAATNNCNKKVTFKTYALFTSCISEINNTQVDVDLAIDVVMLVYNLREYSNINSKTSGNLRQCYKNEPLLHDTHNIIDCFVSNKSSIPSNFKRK